MSIVESSNKQQEEEIVSLNIAPIRRKKFWIDGDANRVLELNTTDMGIVNRLSELYPKLDELSKKFSDVQVQYDEEGVMTDQSLTDLGKALKDMDKEVRSIIDEIFDANVSELMAPSGTMFDMINGSFRFEYIIDTLSNLYADEISKNMQKRKEAVDKRVAKYKGKRKQ